jgi:FeS assembly SUF system protein
MSESLEQSSQSPRVPLNVLPHSGKVEQLRGEIREELKERGMGFEGEEVSKPLAHQSVVDRAIDPRHSPQQKAIVEKVIDAVRTVFDPELPVNIYELGLVYDIAVDEKNAVHVKMTLTAPGCPVAGTLPVEVERKIAGIPEVSSAKVELVWDPPWTKERMSEVALLELGLM